MKRKSIDEIGVFNVLLIGKNPHAVSIADNIHAKFLDSNSGLDNTCEFNIIEDLERDNPSHSWFNEFVFYIATNAGRFNNIVLSASFKDWMVSPRPHIEKSYMSALLKALNFVIIDISNEDEGEYETVFDYDIPHYHFNSDKMFLDDAMKWIDDQYSKLAPKMGTIRLVRSLSGKNVPYLGDVFGCLSGKKFSHIVKADKMRFDVPILFDEYCALMKGKDIKEVRESFVTRSNSALSAFFK